MIFFERINALQNLYSSDKCGFQDNAVLYGICNHQPPLADHVVYRPMTKETMEGLINNYKLNIPQELLTLYRFMNGADLFWSVRHIGNKKIRIPICRFSIYGVPLTYDRKHIEPYNISIEDLSRPNNAPESWLKFGAYYKPQSMVDKIDLFVDTIHSTVFAVEHDSKECCIIEKWNAIDSCLCSIFDLLASQMNAI